MMKRPVLPLAILLFVTLLGYNNCAGPLPELEADLGSIVFSAAAKQTLAFGELTKIDAVGGTPPYTFSIVAPAKGTITAQGMYTAPPAAGADEIQITDSNGAEVRIAVTIVNGGTTGPGSCLLPWGGTVANGGTVTAYQAPTATCPAACVSQVRSCANTVLSGSYTSRSCGNTCPVAVNDTAKVVSPSTTGNVLANDSIPAGGARIMQVTYLNTSIGSQSQTVPPGAVVQINKYAGGTAYLTMSSNGSFTFYCPNAPAEAGCQGSQNITYRVQDAAGRTADASLTIAP